LQAFLPRLNAQGVATAKQSPRRAEAVGILFLAHFTDAAAASVCTNPTIFGGVNHRLYCQNHGCGCAFFDYDNDGWMDIRPFWDSRGTSSGRTNLPTGIIDGTFSDVTAKAACRAGWLARVCVGDYDNDGFEDLFITYWGETSSTTTTG
jgi:hypothetical protein